MDEFFQSFNMPHRSDYEHHYHALVSLQLSAMYAVPCVSLQLSAMHAAKALKQWCPEIAYSMMVAKSLATDIWM